MALSAIDICNEALDMVKATNITSLDEDSESARKCRRIYAKTRDQLLEEYPWNFAIKRENFTEDTEEPLFEYEHQFVIPADCLRILEIYNFTSAWKREGRRLLIDIDGSVDECNVRFIQRITDTGLFDPNFTKALKYQLAAQLAVSIANSDKKAKQYNEVAEMAVRMAEKLNAIEDTTYKDEDETGRDNSCSWVTEGR